MKRCHMFRLLAGMLLLPGMAWAFNPPQDNADPFAAHIEGPDTWENPANPAAYALVIENHGAGEAKLSVQLSSIDGCILTPDFVSGAILAAGAAQRTEFTLAAGPRMFNATYPIHARITATADGQTYSLHPIYIITVRGAANASTPSATSGTPWTVQPGQPVALWQLPSHQTFYSLFSGETGSLPPGWQGSDGTTRLDLRIGDPMPAADGTRTGLSIHPPWFGGKIGVASIEFPVTLPSATPITLRFANAMRLVAGNEPETDGVTFRVRVLPGKQAPGTPGTVVFERHVASHTWTPGEVDLSAYAGQTVRLQLESHPGPKHDCTCDLSYWAEPTILAGPQAVLPAEPVSPPETLGTVRGGGKDFEVSIAPGSQGLLDAAVRFTRDGAAFGWQGFRARVLGSGVGKASGLSPLQSVTREAAEAGHMRLRHRFFSMLGAADLLGEAWVDTGGLRVRFWLENVPKPEPWRDAHIEDLALGPWDQALHRVYAGVGNVLEHPGAFTMGFDGHRLASSYVGYDFENGVSVVQGVDVPPSNVEINPANRHYTLHTANAQTITVIPAASVWQGVNLWRDTNGFKASAGVSKLAGRFVFDLWGGNYAPTADALRAAFRYGLTNSAVVWHAWQRWGYDYRLPDIWPPNPAQGTPEEFRALSQTCFDQGVIFAPHDNLIDIYPDADAFSYTQNVAFNRGREPERSWFNEGRGAQAYRWNPGKFQPMLERNVAAIQAGSRATGYFIDVFSSAAPHDFWTPEGTYSDAVYTRAQWRNAFAWIREKLGDNAPQISESGHDQLVGWLDGAQCNHLRVGPAPKGYYSWSTWDYPCGDAERVPWLDAAYHDVFVLHGAGYEDRFRGGLHPLTHGMYSDDYMSTEVLDGHPGMVSGPFGRDVVRKYWLLNEAMAALGGQRLNNVTFVRNDSHRQQVQWSGGTAWVNRGAKDWTVEGHVLPQYGFYVRAEANGAVYEAAIERRDGIIAEWSRSPAGYFVNARPGKGLPPDAVKWETPEQRAEYLTRINVNNRVLDFGALRTDGAFRLTAEAGALTITPLPEAREAGRVELQWTALPWPLPAPAKIEALDDKGNVLSANAAALENGWLRANCEPGVFAYRVSPGA